MSFTLEQVLQLIGVVVVMIGGGWGLVLRFDAMLTKMRDEQDASRERHREEQDRARKQLETELDEKIESARKRSHELANTIHSVREDIQRKLDIIYAEFLRRDDFHAAVGRFGNDVGRVGEDVRLLNRRMDTMFTMLTGKRPPTEG